MASRKGNPRSDSRPQGTADSQSDRVNFDNMRESKFDKEYQKRSSKSSKQSSRKSASRRSAPQESGGKRDGSNTMAPYLRNPVVLEAVSKVAYPLISGQRTPTFSGLAVPSSMQIMYGTAPLGDDYAVIEQSMNDQYSFVAHANSRNYNYSPEALMVLELAGIDALSLIALGVRAYGLMRRYNALSTYTPSALISSCGFNFDDLVENYARMPGDINLLIAKTRQVWIPRTMTLFDRWWKLNSEIYIDSENGRDQTYAFVPEGYRKLTYNGDGAYRLQFVELYGKKLGLIKPEEAFMSTGAETLKWNEYKKAVNDAIDALLLNQDRGMIYGDLLNAYGAANIISLEFISDELITEPRYDLSMLHEIMNCTISSYQPTDIEHIVTGDRASLKQAWECAPTGLQVETSDLKKTSSVPVVALNDLLLNFKHVEEPSTGEIVNATRLITAGLEGVTSMQNKVDSASLSGWIGNLCTKLTTDGDYTVKPYAFGTEIVIGIAFWYNYLDKDHNKMASGGSLYRALAYYGTQRSDSTWFSADADNVDTLMTVAKRRQDALVDAIITPFDWRPLCYRYNTNCSKITDGWVCKVYNNYNITGSGDITVSVDFFPNVFVPEVVSGEYDNVYQVGSKSLKNMNTACLQSLLGVPISLAASRSTGKNMDRR